MSELTTNLNNILDIKGNIKSAIENKGVDMTGVSFPGYASKIGEITTSFVTVPLNVSVNGTYTPGQGVDGYSQVVVDVPQSVTGFTEKDITEKNYEIINLNNSASFVASSAFNNNQNIKTVNLLYATTVGNNAFDNCTLLSMVNIPVCRSIGYYVFRFCSSLTQIDLPVCSYIGEAAFQECRKLSQVDLPVCSYIGDKAFQNCEKLSQVDLPVCSYIGWIAFQNCSSLSIITIGYSSVCRLGNTAFQGTIITSSTGSIYVPASLVDSYKSATNWSYFSTQIFPISE